MCKHLLTILYDYDYTSIISELQINMFSVPLENVEILISGNCWYIIDTVDSRDKLENCWCAPLNVTPISIIVTTVKNTISKYMFLLYLHFCHSD